MVEEDRKKGRRTSLPPEVPVGAGGLPMGEGGKYPTSHLLVPTLQFLATRAEAGHPPPRTRRRAQGYAQPLRPSTGTPKKAHPERSGFSKC